MKKGTAKKTKNEEKQKRKRNTAAKKSWMINTSVRDLFHIFQR